jgi:cytosine/adenosine deaminase-related metal-dependent hydrolase
MRLLKKREDFSDNTILRWATEGGAAALGLSGITGRLQQGYSADLQLVEWRGEGAPSLLEKPHRVLATFVAGQLCYAAPSERSLRSFYDF